MGFKKENYTLKGLCACVYILLSTNVHSVLGQSHCPIRVDYEPREITQSRSANSIDEIKFPFFQQWQNLDSLRLSDDERATVFLPNNKRSTVFKGKNLGFSIPNGARISGIELIVEGHARGDGIVEGQTVRLLNSAGEAVGSNMALDTLPIDHDWIKSSDSTDFKWRYGSSTDTWGLTISEMMANDIDFGYALQVRNKLNAPITVAVDHIEMIIYYTPLYDICSTHACVPFYVDDTEDPLVTYEWYWPQGFELISDSEEDAAINIGVSYATFGTYEICVESFYNKVSQGICCRDFNYKNCEPSQISGLAFFDKNNDSVNNDNDERIEDLEINLFTSLGSFVSTTFTDENGEYAFSDLAAGQYYIEVINNFDSLLFTTPNVGLASQDSDITGAFGEGTSELIDLQSGDALTSIDVGFNLALTIGDFVWEDLNGDGIQQVEEPGIEGVIINITDSQNVTTSTTTDENGLYTISGIPAGEYAIEFVNSEDYTPTISNNATNDSDSDLIPGATLLVSYTEGGVIDSIDAGYYRPSTIGDFVWEDLNNNGLQDESEPGLGGVVLNLKDANDDLVSTTTSDSLGNYSFEEVAPGIYHIEILPDLLYAPTEFEIDGGLSGDIDSDVFLQDDIFVSAPFTVVSNSSNLSLDFGFIEKPALLGGFTFLDGNNNGQYDSEETFISEVNVFLYNTDDEQVDSTQSDSGGFYLFDDIAPDTYYLVFELKSDLLFTSADVGDDLSDSDVTSIVAIGSTELFNLMPDEENYTISAGFQVKPNVGDFIWLDENGNGRQDPSESGINDVIVELYNDQNVLLQSTVSGPNPESSESGHYLFTSLEVGNYYIKVPTLDLYDFAIIDEFAIGQNSTITNANGFGTSNTFSLIGNQSNLDIDAGYAYKKGNIRGEVWIDLNEDGIQNQNDEMKSEVLIELYSEAGILLFIRSSNENGEYFFNGLDAGNYYIVFTPSDQYRFTTPLTGADFTADSDVTGENGIRSTALIEVMDGVTTDHIDAGLIDGAVDIEGYSWLDDNGDGIQQNSEEPLPNVRVELFNMNDSLLSTTNTDVAGSYTFENNITGLYYLVFSPESDSYINTLADQGSDDSIDDDVTSFFTNGSTDTIHVEFFQDVKPINAGYYELSSIGDQVFIDANENGINDLEPGLNNVIVQLLDDMGTTIATDTTAQGGGLDSGYYLLENIPPGVYTVQFTRPLFYQFVAADQGGDDNFDSDVAEITNNTGTTKEISITSGTEDLSVDAGVFFQIPMESTITGIVWNDTNANGIMDNGELPVPSIPMILLDQNDIELEMQLSNSEGIYIFENLTEGFYSIKATILSNQTATYPNVGADDSIDSDFFDTGDGFETESFFLATFEDIENVDLGLVNTLSIGDFVWEDLNNNGAQDANEIGIEEIEITISSENGIISKTEMSDANGAYLFMDLPAGSYKVCVDLPSGFNFAKSNIGTDILDSDVDSSGCTEFIDFTMGGNINDLDIGLTKNGSVNGIAFVDLNGNGVINTNDPGLDGVIVDLHSDSGELLNSTTTGTVDNIPGVFEFKNLKATDYYLVFEFPEDYIITNPDVGDDLTDSDITGFFSDGSTDLFAIPSGGIVTTVNGGAYLPASIGDEVWLDENENGLRDEGEDGVPNIEVIIFRSFGIPFDTTMTDEEGFYEFENLKQGLYFIQFVIPQEFTISPSDQGIDDNIDSDADDTGKTPLISLAHGADLESVDCGIFSSTASLRSVVWNDINGDGMRQNQEARIPGIKVSLYDDLDNLIKSTVTNSLGLYAFQEIPEGEYKIYVDLGDTDYAFTSMNMNDDDYHDSDIKITGESEIFTSEQEAATLSVPNVDAGLYENGGIVSNVWEDLNADGIYNVNEEAFSNIEVRLYGKGGIYIDKMNSSFEEENVQFKNIPPGEYYMIYKVDQAYVASPMIGDRKDDNNSDLSNFEGYNVTPTFQILANEVVSYIDAGFYKGSTITTNVWYDSNANGIQDESGEVPVSIYATIFDTEGKSFGTKGVNSEGSMHFQGIPKGEYYIKYYSSSDLEFTSSAVDNELNSDVDHSNGTGTTQFFEFEPYESYIHIDAGLLNGKAVVQNSSTTPSTTEKSNIRDTQANDEDELFFEVHPNPAANYIKIKIDETDSDGIITIHNNQNQLVYSGVAKDIDKVYLSEFHPGIYYVKYESSGKSVVKKILKIQ